MNGPPATNGNGAFPTERIIPRATYRLQLRREFNFRSVKKVLPYLSSLGISHLYLSPIFRARPGSTYGYDVINHSQINEELGTLEEFRELSTLARSHELGIILDIVPNHMAVMTEGNEWWLDVLENGPAAKYAGYFDIDWTPLRESMRNRLLVPILENRYGDELHAGRIRIRFDRKRGTFSAYYNEHRFPIDPQCYPEVLARLPAAAHADRDGPELDNILDELGRLPSRRDLATEHVERRYRDKEILKRRLAALCERNPRLCSHIDTAVEQLNGKAGHPQSLDRLAELLHAQPYRLAYWKVAGDEINYRRFFDVNQLAALRAENADVFAATHGLVLELLRERSIDGLRIDHIDGLHDPHKYLEQLRSSTDEAGGRHCYIVVEKILAAHERLRDEWPVEGTTGYEFNALIANWLTSDRGMTHLDWTYRQFVRHQVDYSSLVYSCKKLLMRSSLAAEIAVLGVQLDRIAQAHRDTADFTHFALRDALTEVIAAFPVYRTYIMDCGASSDDAQSISWAVGAARARGKGSDRSIFDFIEDVLLCRPNAAFDRERHHAIVDFTRKFQQVTAPVNAKSVEDTAFYRYFRLLAANEVGGDPRANGLSTTALHRTIADRAKRWPQTLLATSTHDSKRGEDVRFRLCALTELPKFWRQFAAKASRLNRSKHVDLENEPAPTRNDEYLLLQTLAGMWPADVEADVDTAIARVKEYAIKAVREAKEKTSWIDPDIAYEGAVLEFIDGYVAKPKLKRFLDLLKEIVEPLAFFGALNSVSAAILKMTVPGVPDFYQGSELNELSLVDPDNRRVVDFERRVSLCEELSAMTARDGAIATLRDALARYREGQLKFVTIARLLELRRQMVSLFAHGSYEPLEVHGARSSHVCAYARHYGDQSIVVIVARWFAILSGGELALPLGPNIWLDTRVTLPSRLAERDIPGGLVDVLKRQSIAQNPHARARLSDSTDLWLGDLFDLAPFAVLAWNRAASNSGAEDIRE